MNEPNDETIVMVWNENSRTFRARRGRDVKCPECGSSYRDMVWDEDTEGHPMLVCECGEQFNTNVYEED